MSEPQYKQVSGDFIRELTRAQLELRLFVVTLVGNAVDAADVLQETNLDLWKKAETYDPARPFLPWAKTIAWYQVLKFRTEKKRERVVFSDEVLNVMAAALDAQEHGSEELLAALEMCVEKLTERQRAYLVAKYAERKTLDEMAEKFRHSSVAVSSLLYRLRNILHDCVEKTVRMGRA